MSNDAVSLAISRATLVYNTVPLFQELSLHLPAGKCTCLLGPSGIGKSALLKCIAGLNSAARAEITTDSPLSLSRLIGYIPQRIALMPWLSVIHNVMLGSRLRHEDFQTEKALAILTELRLQNYAEVLPHTLSGGQQQRAALAQALYEDRPVLLMDEPFSALDAITRYQLQTLASTVLAHKTILLVTHDPQEALRMAHQIYIMQGAPATLSLFNVPASDTPRDMRDPMLQHYYSELLTVLTDAQEILWEK